MSRLPTKTLTCLTLATVLALALAGTAEAQLFEVAVGVPPVPRNRSTGDDPQTLYSNDSSLPTIIRAAWAEAGSGFSECHAEAHHWSSATFQSDEVGEAWFEFDDLVFTSSSSGNITVGLRLTVQGTSWTESGSVNLQLAANSTGIGTADLFSSGVTSSGSLSGYGMQGAFELEHPISVPVNTPVALRIFLLVRANAALPSSRSAGQYSVELGHPSTGRSGGGVPVFTLPAGVSVDSAQAGIVNNLWAPSTDLELTIHEPEWSPGEENRFYIWNGTAGQPSALILTGIDGATVPFELLGLSLMSADGRSGLGPAPYSAVLSGHSFRLMGASRDAQGYLKLSDEETVVVP